MSAERHILATTNLSKRFGGVIALNDVSLGLGQGRIHGIIGPNGAGKSTLFNVVSGVLKPTAGRVFFEGRDITGLAPHRITRLGIARSFQTPRVFGPLTVWENIALAVERVGSDGRRCRDLLQMVWLDDKADFPAEALAHGEKKRLDMACAIASDPKLLLLDEPTAGMTASETREVADLVRSLARSRTVVVIEHDIEFVKQVAEQVTVLDRGAVLFEGTIDQVVGDQRVRDIYLGERA